MVNEIQKITLAKKSGTPSLPPPKTGLDRFDSQKIVQDRQFMSQHYLRNGESRYAYKVVQESSKKDAQTYICAIMDLAIEARFLSVLQHPHIIKLRAMASFSPYDPSKQFFVVIDKLYCMFDKKLNAWRKQKQTGPKLFRNAKKESSLYRERLAVAYDLGSALQYLHERNIMYRDIKPDNIGFDVRGDVKLFDLGLCKEYDPDTKDANGFYNATGDTGSPRYMAPEVMVGKPYNERVDCYSMAILLWQMMELTEPYKHFTYRMLVARVPKGFRPKCDPKWSSELKTLLASMWDDASKRPSMKRVLQLIDKEMDKYSEGSLGDSDRSDRMQSSRRKSVISLKNLRKAQLVEA